MTKKRIRPDNAEGVMNELLSMMKSGESAAITLIEDDGLIAVLGEGEDMVGWAVDVSIRRVMSGAPAEIAPDGVVFPVETPVETTDGSS